MGPLLKALRDDEDPAQSRQGISSAIDDRLGDHNVPTRPIVIHVGVRKNRWGIRATTYPVTQGLPLTFFPAFLMSPTDPRPISRFRPSLAMITSIYQWGTRGRRQRQWRACAGQGLVVHSILIPDDLRCCSRKRRRRTYLPCQIPLLLCDPWFGGEASRCRLAVDWEMLYPISLGQVEAQSTLPQPCTQAKPPNPYTYSSHCTSTLEACPAVGLAGPPELDVWVVCQAKLS